MTFRSPRGGAIYDPRPLEDKAGQRIAYLLIALLALLVDSTSTPAPFSLIAW